MISVEDFGGSIGKRNYRYQSVMCCGGEGLRFMYGLLFGWLVVSHRQQGHLETAPPFTVPCEGHKARFYAVPTGN